MTWAEACADRSLRDLPYKIELNRWGRLEMSPHRKEHSAFQGRIVKHLHRLLKHGEVLAECAIDTADGVRVADVAWCSEARWASLSDAPSCSIAPELCVEVLSWSNAAPDIEAKGRLYLAAGAQEFWVCAEDGTLRFYDAGGRIRQSALCPKFPARIRL